MSPGGQGLAWAILFPSSADFNHHPGYSWVFPADRSGGTLDRDDHRPDRPGRLARRASSYGHGAGCGPHRSACARHYRPECDRDRFPAGRAGQGDGVAGCRAHDSLGRRREARSLRISSRIDGARSSLRIIPDSRARLPRKHRGAEDPAAGLSRGRRTGFAASRFVMSRRLAVRLGHAPVVESLVESRLVDTRLPRHVA